MLSGSSLIIGGELNSAWNLQSDRIRRGKWLIGRSKLIGTVLIDVSAAGSDVLEPGIGDPAGRPKATNAAERGSTDAERVVAGGGAPYHGARHGA